ncbi:hypothetical protein AAY473_019890 [Plecturocebus cupreus]
MSTTRVSLPEECGQQPQVGVLWDVQDLGRPRWQVGKAFRSSSERQKSLLLTPNSAPPQMPSLCFSSPSNSD